MSEVNAVKKKTLGDRFAEFKAMEGADKRRVISGALINNAMYIIIAIAVIFIAIKVPAFVRLPSIINIISLTAAKLPIALGIGGAIVLTGTDISAARCWPRRFPVCWSDCSMSRARHTFPASRLLSSLTPERASTLRSAWSLPWSWHLCSPRSPIKSKKTR